MVVPDAALRADKNARDVLFSLGMDIETMRRARVANPSMEWISVMRALDRVFLSHGGASGQVNFLHTPSEALDGRTPIVAIAGPGGPQQVCEAARIFASAA